MLWERLLAACAALAATTGLVGAVDGHARRSSVTDVEELTRRATEANRSLMRGDIASYRRFISFADDFILMDPFGGRPSGPPQSEERWQRLGRFFRDARDATFELIRSYRSPQLIVLVANERAHVAVGRLPAQPWALRVTLVFRRDDGEWRLVHRHADPLVGGISQEEAGRITLGGAASNSNG